MVGMAPWTVGPERGPRVLLLHGLTGSPAELWPLACGLAATGLRCEVPWWEGHGTSPLDLAGTPAERLIAQSRALGTGGWEAVVGLSMGALLGVVAASGLARPAPLVMLAPAWRMAGSARAYSWLSLVPRRLASRALLSKSTEWGVDAHGPAGVAGLAAGAAPVRSEGRYDAIPVAWARRLEEVRREARFRARRVPGPVMLVHGLSDRTAHPGSTLEVAAWFRAPRVEWVAGAGHQLGAGGARSRVADLVAGFLSGTMARGPRNTA